MPGTALGFFVVDFIIRPFARIFEKWPITMVLFLLILYGIVGYIVVRSAYLADQHH